MKGGKAPLGYTIVEVMVVLAVSSFMFLMATQFVNGKQAEASFTQGVNDLANRIESIAGQVSDGQFTDINLQNCKTTSGDVAFSTLPGDIGEQGENLSCVFLGKILYFNDNNGATQTAQNFTLFSLAGTLNDLTTNQPITDITESHATVVPGLAATQPTPQSLDVRQMRVVDAATGQQDNFSFGFVQGLATSSGGTYQTGSQVTALVYSPGLNRFQTSLLANPNPSADIKNNVRAATSVQMCVSDDTRRAILTVNTRTNGLNVDINHLDRNGTSQCW